ncbi:hypothetical protein G9A89_000053, partial [Geosiphon pyriformis]
KLTEDMLKKRIKGRSLSMDSLKALKFSSRGSLPQLPQGEKPENFRIKIENPRVLYNFKKYAYFANRAYCLNSPENALSKEAYAQAILTPYNEVIVFIRVKGPTFNIYDPDIFGTGFGPDYSAYPVKGLYVHRKFYHKYFNAEERLIELVDAQLNQAKNRTKISFTGHGFGAGHAVFLALYYRRKIPELPISVYTFSELRLGIDFFGEYVSTQLPNLYRITFGSDIAPTYPLNNENTVTPKYVQHHREFWIPFTEGCDCLNDEQDVPTVFECLPEQYPFAHKSYESQYCLNGKKADLKKRLDSFQGPYFGETMGMPKNCEVLQDFPPL